MAQSTAKKFCCLLKDFIPSRLFPVISMYLTSLAIRSDHHGPLHAEELSGLHRAQFSRMLSGHRVLSESLLESAGKLVSSEAAEAREPLFNGAPWTAALIVDSTIQERANQRIQNSQKFNKGGGYVIGHQWTNILLFVNETLIPLPPIPFFSKNECKRRGIAYQTEHARLIAYLKSLDLTPYLGPFNASEIVVLLDSGYDNKELQTTIVGRGWDLVAALKCNRLAKTKHMGQFFSPKGYSQTQDLFRRVKRYAPQETVRITSAANKKKKKRMKLRLRRIEGKLKGLECPVVLICSKKISGKKATSKPKYLACTNLTIGTRAIALAYTLRWRVEIFHRETKLSLGMEGPALHKFDSMTTHVNMVYVAYLLLNHQRGDPSQGIVEAQKNLEKKLRSCGIRKIVQISSRFNGAAQLKKHFNQVKGGVIAA